MLLSQSEMKDLVLHDKKLIILIINKNFNKKYSIYYYYNFILKIYKSILSSLFYNYIYLSFYVHFKILKSFKH
jgi:hypothetical protein